VKGVLVPFSMDEALRRISPLNRKLKPLAERRVDLNDPEWQEKMRRAQPALDEAGIRLEAEELLEEILEGYSKGDAPLRDAIRKLLAQHRAFTWATGVVAPPTTKYGFRQHLLRLSAVDHAMDLRDTFLELGALCDDAQAAGVDIGPILREVAELSSDVPMSYMGSVKAMLQKLGSSR
jgi:hypothetical protein